MARRSAFDMEADAAYGRRKREAFHSLRRGDRITADIGGARVVATVIGHLSPDLLVRTLDGKEHLISRYQFGARRVG